MEKKRGGGREGERRETYGGEGTQKGGGGERRRKEKEKLPKEGTCTRGWRRRGESALSLKVKSLCSLNCVAGTALSPHHCPETETDKGAHGKSVASFFLCQQSVHS